MAALRPPVALVLWSAAPVSLVGAAVSSRALSAHGHDDLAGLSAAHLVFVLAMLSASTVGLVLGLRRPAHPVGWLFLGLGTAIALAVGTDAYAVYGAVAERGSLPGADEAAVVGDATFVPWLVCVALVLHLTPNGRFLSPRWACAAAVTAFAGATMLVTTLLSDAPLESPYGAVQNPWALHGSALAGVNLVELVAGVLTGVGVVIGGASLLCRVRRAGPEERLQLRWMRLVVIPLPLFVAGSFAAAVTEHPLGLALATGGFVVLIPLSAGLSAAKYHLYDVDRVLTRATAYVVVTVLLGLAYAVVVLATSSLVGGHSSAAAVATLVTATAAGPAYRRTQRAVDRRYNRRQYDALAQVRRHVADPAPGDELEAVLRRATGDPTLLVGYWLDARGPWVTAEGLPYSPTASAVVAERHGRAVACVDFDAAATDHDLVQAVVAEALPELDNVRLRAEVAKQLVEVRESRARLATAQLDERRAVERDLHDGAQQRLLALAMQLQAAHLNGDGDRARDALLLGVQEARAAVEELRRLANGLYPTALSDGGLLGALEELAARSALPVDLDVTEERFAPTLESTAWFIACEGVVNAVKHSGAERVQVLARRTGAVLVVEVRDDGRGGSDPAGHGLSGLRDRAEAAGGSLTVENGSPGGTSLRAELPCGS